MISLGEFLRRNTSNHPILSKSSSRSVWLTVRPPSRRQSQQHTVCQRGFGTSTRKQERRANNFSKKDSDWINVANLAVFQGKQIKAIELKDKTFVVLYNVNGNIFCSDANSTAYQFPLANAKIIDREQGPAVEVALDGTVYDLETGKVLEWCPRNNPLRALLGVIKSNQNPENLKVYPTRTDEASGQIYVRFT